MADSAPLTPRAAIASICGLREDEVTVFVEAGIMPKPLVAGRFDVPACCAAYIAHLKASRVPKLTSARELAIEFGVSEQLVHKMFRDGMPKAKRGNFDRTACWRWRLERCQSANSGDNSDLQEERRLLVVEQRRKARMEADAAERSLVPREEVEQGWMVLVGLVRSEMLALAGRLAGEVANVSSPAQARKIIDAESRRILNRLRGEFSTIVARLRSVS
jgi:phage terminase Nu1 subunit (DNA packaging protein)